MSLLRRTCATLISVFMLVAGTGRADQSHWNLSAAPPELASYGFAYGIQILDDPTATYYLAEYKPFPTNPNPPEAVVVALAKAGADQPFVAFEATPVKDASGADVPGRRVAPGETQRFNDVIFPALARAHPPLARAIRLHHFVYAKGRHLRPTADYKVQQQLRRAKHEQPLLELWWQRDSARQPFAPYPAHVKGLPISGFPVTIAEASRERAPIAASAPVVTQRAQVAHAISPHPYFEARYCQSLAGAFKDAALADGWNMVVKRRIGGLTAAQFQEFEDLVLDFAPLAVDDEARKEYEQCRARLAFVRGEQKQQRTVEQSARAVPQRDLKRRGFNPHAPAKYTVFDLAGDLAGSRDLVEHEGFRNKSRAWNAYCWVSSEAFHRFSAQNPAAFGLDPKRVEDAKRMERIDAQRGLFRTKLLNDFKPDQKSQAQSFVDLQQVNYRKGLDERRNSDGDMANYVVVQVSECDSEFFLWWGTKP